MPSTSVGGERWAPGVGTVVRTDDPVRDEVRDLVDASYPAANKWSGDSLRWSYSMTDGKARNRRFQYAAYVDLFGVYAPFSK